MKAVEDKVEVVHKATNSMKDALVAAEKSKSHAEGVKEGETGVATPPDPVKSPKTV